MFLTPLRVERVGSRWRLTAPLVWEDRDRRITVPAGFVTDFASVPRFPPVAYALLGDRFHAAAVLHDWLYREDGVSRREADEVLRRAAIEEDTPRWLAWLAWLGVRLFAWPAWARYRGERSSPPSRVALVALALAAPSLVWAVLSPGHLGVTRLWSVRGEREFTCTAFFVQGSPRGLVTVVTAGHCAASGQVVGRSADGASFQYVDWRAVLDGRIGLHRRWDLAIGTAPEPEAWRPLWLADRSPSPGTPVWIIGFPRGVEAVAACVWGAAAGPVRGMALPGTVDVHCDRDAIRPGSSGSPVIRGDGFVVGVLWGRDPDNPTRTLVTPIEAYHALAALLTSAGADP